MDEYNEVLILDARNAPPPMRSPPPVMMTRPPARPYPPAPTQPYYQQPTYYRPMPPMPPQRPVVILQRPPSILDGIDWGAVVEQGTTLLAAVQGLPDAPTVTGKVGNDVANMIVYQ